MTPEIIELQDKIAQGLVDGMTEPFERIVVNLEIELTPEGHVLDYVYFYISSLPDGDFRETSLTDFPDVVSDLFVDLNDAMAQSERDKWGTCDLVIESTGECKFTYDYDAPKRMNGIDNSERFENYLDTFKAERAANGT